MEVGIFVCLLGFSEAYFVKPHKKKIRCHAHFPPSPGICLSLVSALAPRQTPAKCRFKLVPENTDQVTVMHKSVPFCWGKCLEIIVRLCHCFCQDIRELLCFSCCNPLPSTHLLGTAIPSPTVWNSAFHRNLLLFCILPCITGPSFRVLHAKYTWLAGPHLSLWRFSLAGATGKRRGNPFAVRWPQALLPLLHCSSESTAIFLKEPTRIFNDWSSLPRRLFTALKPLTLIHQTIWANHRSIKIRVFSLK